MPTDEDEYDGSGIIEFSLMQVRSEKLYAQLTDGQREYLHHWVDAAMEFSAAERGNLPHHGASAVVAWLGRCEVLSDEALANACVFIAAMERWERDHAGT